MFLPGCGGVIHADSGSFKSPNYPQNFPANVECLWQVVAHEGNHLELSFNSNFQIPDTSGQCQSSYVKVGEQLEAAADVGLCHLLICNQLPLLVLLQVWAGQTQEAEALLSTGCGSVAPGPIVAPYNVITSRFQSTGSTGTGFSASFRTSKNQTDTFTSAVQH